MHCCREMTAENLFSTLLTRVKSLTKKIHDEHQEHMHWQKSQNIIRQWRLCSARLKNKSILLTFSHFSRLYVDYNVHISTGWSIRLYTNFC